MMQEALRALKDKMKSHIDARDTERATLLSWPDNVSIQVDGDPYPYTAEYLSFADYLQERHIEARFEVGEYTDGDEAKGSVTGLLANGTDYESGAPYEQQPRSSLKGILTIPSPLQVGDRLIVSRMSDRRGYYITGKEVSHLG
ncbi:hypothetical protein [Paenibacillus kandeliae]|uniref:hypothetical protein n=1 Tax=Paenibacillus kandeliae TaxID=3231269 RepID=UPI00345AF9FC